MVASVRRQYSISESILSDLHRARQHVADVRPRFDASPDHRKKLLEKFLRAAATRDLQELVALLSTDVVLHTDGGGKAPAIPNLVYGADNVARAILGRLSKLVPKNLVRRITEINGQPSVVSYFERRPYSVLTLDPAEGRIRPIYIVSNPEKLSHLPEWSPAASSTIVPLWRKSVTRLFTRWSSVAGMDFVRTVATRLTPVKRLRLEMLCIFVGVEVPRGAR